MLKMKKTDSPCFNFRDTFAGLIVSLLLVSVFSFGMLSKKQPVMKFCFNSRDQFVAGQCVFCDYYKFTATVLFCNGMTTALMSNISSTEGFCIMSQCLQQIRQNQPPMFGRKKRSAEIPLLAEDDDGGESVEDDDGGESVEDENGNNDRENVKELPTLAATSTTHSPASEDIHKQFMSSDEEMLKELESRVVDTIKVDIIESVHVDEYEDE